MPLYGSFITNSSTSSFIDHEERSRLSFLFPSLSLSKLSFDCSFKGVRRHLRRPFAVLARSNSKESERNSLDSTQSGCGDSNSSGDVSPLHFVESDDSDDDSSIISEWCFVPTEREHLIEAANVELEALRRRAYTAMVLMECLEKCAFPTTRVASYKDFHLHRRERIEDLYEIDRLLTDVWKFATLISNRLKPMRTSEAYEPSMGELERMLNEVAVGNDWTGKEHERVWEVLFCL